MGSVNYLIHPDDLSLTAQQEYRYKALAAGISRAFAKSIGSPDDVPGWGDAPSERAKSKLVLDFIKAGNWPDSLDVKDLENSLVDLVVAPLLDQWNTAALAAIGGAVSCFQGVAAPQLQDTKLAVFWRVSILTIPLPVSRLIFRTGGAAGNILAQFDLEQIGSKDTLEGIFSEPVVIDPRQVFAAQVLTSILTGAAAQVILDCFVLEQAGRTVA